MGECTIIHFSYNRRCYQPFSNEPVRAEMSTRHLALNEGYVIPIHKRHIRRANFRKIVFSIVCKMLLKVCSLARIPRRFVSALYISGDKALGNIAVLTPVLDFEKRLGDQAKLVENITRRKCVSFDVNDLYGHYELYKTIRERKAMVEKRREELVQLMRGLAKEIESPENEDSIRKYKLEAIALREDARNLREHSYSIESKFIDNFLDIPNDIHDKTPDTATLLASTNEIAKASDEPSPSHLEYENQIEYYDESAYYLKEEAAQFDLHFPLYCVDFFRERNFIQFSNPDFAKTVLVEGGAVPLDEVYEVRHETHEKCTNLLHLVGGGSMLSYLGFIAKLKVFSTQFPLRWICAGKQYMPKGETHGMGLLDVCQSTCVHAFLAGTQEQMDSQFEETIKHTQQLYESLGVHFRAMYVAADELRPAECLSVRFEMYSPHLQRYVEVGQLSHFSDYISKRILFNYDENKKSQFPHIVTGTVCNVTKVLAILLENNRGQIKESFRKIV